MANRLDHTCRLGDPETLHLFVQRRCVYAEQARRARLAAARLRKGAFNQPRLEPPDLLIQVDARSNVERAPLLEQRLRPQDHRRPLQRRDRLANDLEAVGFPTGTRPRLGGRRAGTGRRERFVWLGAVRVRAPRGSLTMRYSRSLRLRS